MPGLARSRLTTAADIGGPGSVRAADTDDTEVVPPGLWSAAGPAASALLSIGLTTQLRCGQLVAILSGYMTIVHEPARDLPVLGEFDVVVCGGGPGGCAAATAAARHGANTLLIEKGGALGGAPVTQGVCVVLSTNAVDFQGIWHQWARRLEKYNGIGRFVRTGSHLYPNEIEWFRTSVDPECVKRVWDELVDEAGARQLLHSYAAGVVKDENAVVGVILETRAGRQVVRGRRVIDATGDAIVCNQAGVPWHRGIEDKPWPQAVSLTGVAGFTSGMPGYVPGEMRDGGPGTRGNRPERGFGRGDKKKVDPLDPWSVSDATRTLRREMWESASGLPAEQYLIETAAELGVRTSRIIVGRDTVTGDDAWDYRRRDDGIARSSWELDIHPPDDEPVPERYLHSRSAAYSERNKRSAAGEYFDIPYRALIASQVDNLLVAGRIVSSELLAQGSLRIQQTCMSTGQAAGTAVALSIAYNVLPQNLDIAKLQATLAKDRDIEPALGLLPYPP